MLCLHTLLRFRERVHLMVRVTGSPRARQRRMRRTRWSKQSAVSTRSPLRRCRPTAMLPLRRVKGPLLGRMMAPPGRVGIVRGTDAEALPRLHAVVVHHGLQPNALQSRLGQGRGSIVQWGKGVKGKKKPRQANAGDGKLLETFVELFGGQEKLFGRFWRK